MLRKFFNKFDLLNLRFYSVLKMENFDKKFIVHEREEGRLFISFKYVNTSLKVDRTFNFSRNKEEGIESILEKISARIRQVCIQRNKKIKDFDVEIPVSLINSQDNEILFTKTSSENLVQQRFRKRKPASESDAKSIKLSDVNEILELTSNKVVNPSSLHLIDNASTNVVKINDIEYPIELNPPIVENVYFPKVIMAGYLLYPSEIKAENVNEKECIYDWYVSSKTFPTKEDALKSSNKVEWLHRSQGFHYKTILDDLHKIFKVSTVYIFV